LLNGGTYETSLRAVLTCAYGACLLAAGIGAAIQWRRRSNRFLLAMVTPWVLFFALLPYLNNRYLLWAAACFPLLIPVGLGITLLGALLCLACCAMLLEIMTRYNGNSNQTLASITHGMYPGLGYVVLLIAAIFLFNCLVVTRRDEFKSAG
jgi:hypothetical protein